MAENLKEPLAPPLQRDVLNCNVPCKMSWDEMEVLCRRERLRCRQLGVIGANINDYEVEFLCDYKKIREEEFYLVKWKGYPEADNSWEPKRNLKCSKLMKQFHQDLDLELRRHKRHTTPKRLDKEVSSFLMQKAKVRQNLLRWEVHLNETRNHPGHIFVVNDVDLEGPPKNFTYINNYKVGQGIVLNVMAVGCECKDCFHEPVNGCCPGASLHRMAYNEKGQVRIRPGKPIYECNSQCSCDPDCPNRVVQKGIQIDLCIFKTENGRGWGVRTLQHIKKNVFVMEYVGEIITTDEAERRGHIYDREGSTYLFDLDYVEDVYTVDAAHHGNISHFVNHSCNPNLQVFNVFVDNIDERLPRIALFSTRPIRAGEELTFDYKMHIDPVDTESTKMDSSFSLAGLNSSPKKRIRVECRCGSDSCRKYLF
ncbi:histone-lysine N-methyltransferase SUV39H1-like isoform X1 [Antennarius striatus]|uniref:histone-lysine N-methyltransferase SUV39H1-like isoform X1 n=2 Tax=Antennarius striatus TaxID=241820 RepID=UPI0035B257E6